MTITWLGYSCFKIQTKNATILIDPPAPEIGYKIGKQNVEIALITHEHFSHNNRDVIGGEALIFDKPGEFEAKDIFVYGIPSYHDKKSGEERGQNTMFLIEAEGISVAHLGDLGHPLTTEEKERLSDVDILMIPVGGGDSLGYKEAVEVINQIEPRIIIPMHFQISEQKTKLEGVDKFAKEMGVSPKAELDKLKISAKDLPEEKTQTIILQKV